MCHKKTLILIHVIIFKMSEIPSLLKKNSTYIRTIDEYSEEFIFEIIQKLIATEEFWKIAIEDTSLIPEKIIGDADKEDFAKKLRKQNLECIEVVKKRLGKEKFEEYCDKKSITKIKTKNYFKNIDFADVLVKTFYLILAIFTVWFIYEISQTETSSSGSDDELQEAIDAICKVTGCY